MLDGPKRVGSVEGALSRPWAVAGSGGGIREAGGPGIDGVAGGRPGSARACRGSPCDMWEVVGRVRRLGPTVGLLPRMQVFT